MREVEPGQKAKLSPSQAKSSRKKWNLNDSADLARQGVIICFKAELKEQKIKDLTENLKTLRFSYLKSMNFIS